MIRIPAALIPDPLRRLRGPDATDSVPAAGVRHSAAVLAARWRCILLAVAGAAVLTSGCEHSATSSKDAASSALNASPAGSERLVEIGGNRKMFIQCRGSGSPTVVLVSGFRGAYDDWTHVGDPTDPDARLRTAESAVFFQAAAFTQVCAYDRPGTTRFDGSLAPSTPVPQPTTAQQSAADLHALLVAAEKPGPYVLVAHSWGGLIARAFAATYPDDVCGLVLVDPGSEFLQSTLEPSQWETFARAAKQLGDPTQLEAADYEQTVAAFRPAPSRREMPIVVLTADKPFDFGAGPATWPAWRAAHDRLATLLKARHITNTRSGHAIQIEQPQLVVDAIGEVVDAARQQGVK